MEMATTNQEIIRCKECACFLKEGGFCTRWAYGTYDEETGADIIDCYEVEPDGFCAWAEKKEQA